MGNGASMKNLPTNEKFAQTIVQYNEGALKGMDNLEIFQNLSVSAPSSRNSFELPQYDPRKDRKSSLRPRFEQLARAGGQAIAKVKEADSPKASSRAHLNKTVGPTVQAPHPLSPQGRLEGDAKGDKDTEAMISAVRQNAFNQKRRGKSLDKGMKMTVPSQVTIDNAPDFREIKKHLRRAQIFSKGENVDEARKNFKRDRTKDRARRKARAQISEEVKALVAYALKDFFFVGGELFQHLHLVFDVMELEVLRRGECLMKQGEKGDKLYVVEHGTFDVEVDGLWVAEKGPGERVGDLALMYNAPRNATVRCKTQAATVWSLARKPFQQLQALSSSAALVRRSMWLHAVGRLQALDRYSLSKLVQELQPVVFEPGEALLRAGEPTTACYLIERGMAEVVSEEDPAVVAELLHVVPPGGLPGQAPPPAAAAAPQGAGEGAKAEGDGAGQGTLTISVSPRVQGAGAGAGAGGGGELISAAQLAHDLSRLNSAAPSVRPSLAIARIRAGAVGLTLPSARAIAAAAAAAAPLPAGEGTGEAAAAAQPKAGAAAGGGGGSGGGGGGGGGGPKPRLALKEGCFLGVPVLLAAGGFEGGWSWRAVQPASPKAPTTPPAALAPDGAKVTFEDAAAAGDADEFGSPLLAARRKRRARPGEGAVAPFAVVAQTRVQALRFTCDGFEELLGPIDEVLDAAGAGDGFEGAFRGGDTQALDFLPRANPLQGLALCKADFEEVSFLGRGSFGWVTQCRKRAGPLAGELFAVKELSKQGMVEHDQVQHVRDERRMLLESTHPFILQLYGTFQDAGHIYFVTELVTGGELWSVIYEGASGQPTTGLPPSHARFYGAVVAEALGHFHKRGIAYRDLKPENLMIDANGYLRVIDLGFAKKIPFPTLVDGAEQVQYQSYTMCGTPEYLAPEFIYNTGHDHTADLWALGVLVYELVVGHTPFVKPGKEPDMTELFTKIALSKRQGIAFSANFDRKANCAATRDLVKKLMHHEPQKRLGNLARRMGDVKAHPHFQGTRWQELVRMEVESPWKPPESPTKTRKEKRDPSLVFKGDQSIFADF